ncbi:MAG TPA: hypothetical protein VD763_01080 [Candidatus Saccharimonadales bacterium]|nr:hypothetical protein [Candidatus Saccharimonadales bacterium]
MSDKKFRLPKDGVVEPDGAPNLIDDNDVEGHGLPVTPPPAMPHRSPGHGGENIPTVEDEGGPESVARF